VSTLLRRIENLAGEIRSISSILHSHEKQLENINNLSPDSSRKYSELACYFAGLVGQYEIGLRTLKQFNYDVDIDSKLSLLRLNFGGSQLKVRRKALAIEFAKYEFNKLHELSAGNSEDAFTFACELRHLIAVTRALSSEELMSELNEICSKFLIEFNNLDQTSRGRVSRSIANLLADYKMYPSVKLAANTSLADTHWVLFEAANLNGSEKMRINGLTDALEKSKVNSEIKKTIQIVLSSIQEIVSESGRGALSIVGDERAMPWPREIGDLNIIPGEGTSNCSSVILAIADSSKRSGRYSPKSVMTKVQQSIIRCRGTLKAVIFLTDPAAIGGEVEEHLPIIEDNIQAGDIEIFLPVTIVGRRLNVLDWK
jgi:hypothetical protein